MTPRRIVAIAGLALATAGVLCVALCMFQPVGNQTLMNLGLNIAGKVLSPQDLRNTSYTARGCLTQSSIFPSPTAPPTVSPRTM